MVERPYELAWTAEGVVARVRVRGRAVLASPQPGRQRQHRQIMSSLVFSAAAGPRVR